MSTLRRRLLITDKGTPGHLRSEALVHLIRHGLRTADNRLTDAVLPVRLGRCEAILATKVSDRLPNAEKLREDVLSEFGELLASDVTGQSEELDFYECRFNLAFRALRLDVLGRELAAVNRAADLPDQGNEGEPDAYA